MTTKKSTGRKAEPLDPQVADKLLDLLSTDNDFRRLFKRDPLEALIRVGYKPPEGPRLTAAKKSLSTDAEVVASPATCLKVGRIATKQAIAQAREEIRSTLVDGLGFIPHMLDADYTASRGARNRRK